MAFNMVMAFLVAMSQVSSVVSQGGADAAAAALATLVENVPGMLTSGSGCRAVVAWTGGQLEYKIFENHGKVIFDGSDSYGGKIGVTKENSAWIGAEHTIDLLSGGVKIAEVHLETFYSEGQSGAVLVFGAEHFQEETVYSDCSTVLNLAWID